MHHLDNAGIRERATEVAFSLQHRHQPLGFWGVVKPRSAAFSLPCIPFESMMVFMPPPTAAIWPCALVPISRSSPVSAPFCSKILKIYFWHLLISIPWGAREQGRIGNSLL